MPYGRRQCAAGNLFPYDYDADTFKVSSRVSSRVARGYIAALPRTVKLGTFCSPLSEKQSPGNLPIPGAREYIIVAAFLGCPARAVMSRSTADVLCLVCHFEYYR